MLQFILSNVLTYGSLFAAVVFFGFGVWLAASERHDPRRQSFAAVIGAAALWLLAFAMWRVAVDGVQVAFWARLMHVGAVILPTVLLVQAVAWLTGKWLRPWLLAAVAAAVVLAAWLIFGLNGGLPADGSSLSHAGTVRAFLAIDFALLFTSAMIVFMLASHRRHNDSDKGAITAMLVGGIISLNSVFSVMYGLSFNRAEIGYGWTILTAVGGVVIMAMFLLQQRLLVDLRFIGMEAVILLALMMLTTDIVANADSPIEFAFRLAVLVLLAIYGILATRAMVHDSRQLQQNEKLREQLIMTNGRLIEADRFKTKFVSFVSHQMQTPLSGIYVYLDMARKEKFGPMPERFQPILEANLEALDRLSRTAETFLNVTKIELGKINVFKTDNDVGAVALKVVQELHPLAERKGLDLAARDVPRLLTAVFDNSLVYHALFNLADNAIKYTPRGSVAVAAVREGDWLKFSVRDTGVGLSEDDRRGLFQVFERGISAVRLESKGAGLGLYIVLQFVKAHGGEAFFESPGQGQGSTFGFRIPFEAG